MEQASPNFSAITANSSLIDNQGIFWGINQDGKVTRSLNDGHTPPIVDDTTANVDALAWVDGTIWQQAHPPWDPSHVYWWAWNGSGWGPGQMNSPLQGHPTEGQTVTNQLSPLVDENGDLWWISSGKQVVKNGEVDQLTNRVIELAVKDGVIWQENTDLLWWKKTNEGYDGWGQQTTANPVPVLRVYQDTGDHFANEAQNWSGNHAPIAGDGLQMPNGGIMNVGVNALQGDTITIGDSSGNASPATFNLSDRSESFSFDEGNSTRGGNVVVNIQDMTRWIGGMHLGLSSSPVAVNGGGTWQNTDSVVDGNVIVNVPVLGDGTITVSNAHRPSATMEFLHSVSHDQQLTVTGYAFYGGQFGEVIVDDINYNPDTNLAEFNPQVTLGFGEVLLKGLQADSYMWDGSFIQLTKNGKPVDGLYLKLGDHVNDPGQNGPTDFGISQIGAGVMIHANGNSYSDGGTLLPSVHVGA